MYLIFYLSALFRLGGIERITSEFLPGWGSRAIFITVAGNGGRGHPVTLLSDLGGGLRSPGIGSKISAHVPADIGRWTSYGRWPRFCWLTRSALAWPLPPPRRFCMYPFRSGPCCGWPTRENHVGTAALGCPARQHSANLLSTKICRASLDRTAGGGCPPFMVIFRTPLTKAAYHRLRPRQKCFCPGTSDTIAEFRLRFQIDRYARTGLRTEI